jgi:DeoR family myo-inositol catabolism operon transcriptional repressor
LKSDRIRQLEEFIRINDTVSLGEICKRFDISMNTVRRDVSELVEKGAVKKIYGGVSSVSKTLIPFDERNVKHNREKKLIAKAAAALVEDRDIIFIDSGTTTHHMASFLKDKNVTIVTHSLNVIVDALPFHNLNVIAMGGSLARKTNSFSGVHTLEALQDININKAFLAATGLSLTSGATNSSPLEYEIKKNVAEKSRFTCLLVDSSKFGVSSLMTYCRIPDFDAVVTDRSPGDEYLQQFEEDGVRLIVAR